MDFEQLQGLSTTGKNVYEAAKNPKLLSMKPEVVPFEKFRLKPIEESEIKKRFSGFDLGQILELRKIRPDLEFLIDNEPDSNLLYVRRPAKNGDDQDLLFTFSPGFAVGGRGTFPSLANDIYIGGKDNKYLSVRSIFPDRGDLTIRLSLLNYEHPNKPTLPVSGQHSETLFLYSFGTYFAYDMRDHSLHLFEPDYTLSLAIVGHEAGHAWLVKMDMIKTSEDFEVGFSTEKVWQKIERFDPTILAGIQEVRSQERLASFFSRQITKRVNESGFDQFDNVGGLPDRQFLEHALASYDKGFAYILLAYSDKYRLDPKTLFGARENRTEEGIQKIRKALEFAKSINETLEIAILRLLDGEKFKKQSNDWGEPYRREIWFDNNKKHLSIGITSKGRFLYGEFTDRTDPDNVSEFTWNPHEEVKYSDSKQTIEVFPSALTTNSNEDYAILRKRAQELQGYLEAIQ